jgi:hypothetical protein
MKLAYIIPIVFFFSAPLALAQTDNSVGVSPYHDEATEKYHLFYGMGANLGWIGAAPSLTDICLTVAYQKTPVFFGIDFLGSSGAGNSYTQTTLTAVDLLVGYSWDQIIPVYHGPASRIHYEIATGLSFDNYTHLLTQITTNYMFYPPTDTVSSQITEAGIGFPLRFAAIYEPFSFWGVGVSLFYTVGKLPPSYGGAGVLEVRF